MTKYNPAVLQEYADSLYAKAFWATFKCGVTGAIIGIVLAWVLNGISATRVGLSQTSNPDAAMVVFGLVTTLIGVAIGQRRSFEFRLRAQTVLCQMQIERNTRRDEQG